MTNKVTVKTDKSKVKIGESVTFSGKLVNVVEKLEIPIPNIEIIISINFKGEGLEVSSGKIIKTDNSGNYSFTWLVPDKITWTDQQLKKQERDLTPAIYPMTVYARTSPVIWEGTSLEIEAKEIELEKIAIGAVVVLGLIGGGVALARRRKK